MTVNPEVEVQAGGQTWRVVPPRQVDKTEFSRWLKQKARQEVVEAKKDLPEEDYQQQLREVMMAGAAGVYGWSDKLCQVSLKHTAGRQYMLMLVLMRNHPEVKEEQVAELYAEAQDAFDAALDKVLWPVPNLKPPEPPAAKTA